MTRATLHGCPRIVLRAFRHLLTNGFTRIVERARAVRIDPNDLRDVAIARTKFDVDAATYRNRPAARSAVLLPRLMGDPLHVARLAVNADRGRLLPIGNLQ